MVNVGDKVFVAPLYGQKDNIAVVSSGGIQEGRYNTYTSLGAITLNPRPRYKDYLSVLVDTTNDILYIPYLAKPGAVLEERLASYQLPGLVEIQNLQNDANLQYESAAGGGHGLVLTSSSYYTASLSGLYMLQLNDNDSGYIINSAGVELCTIPSIFGVIEMFYISVDGKYIIGTEAHNVPYRIEVIQGSCVPEECTSTHIEETILMDSSKSWIPKTLIRKSVHITSGDAKDKYAIITDNDATSVTCARAKFVEWEMSVGDTFELSC